MNQSINQSIGKLHCYECFCTNGLSYNCPGLKFWGYSTERALKNRIGKLVKTLKSQSELCKAAHA